MNMLRPHFALLLATSLAAFGCTSTAETSEDAFASAIGEAGERLRVTTDAMEQRLAAVEKVEGFNMKAVAVWQRDTTNGRDLWITLRRGPTSRAWRTREDVFALKGMQYATGLVSFLGVERGLTSDGYENELPFTLAVPTPADGTTLLDLTKTRHGSASRYQVDVETGPFADLVGRIDGLSVVENPYFKVRLVELVTPEDEVDLFLVLTDAQKNLVFPLRLRAARAGDLAFASDRSVTFATYDAQGTATKRAVTWDRIDAPSIKVVR